MGFVFAGFSGFRVGLLRGMALFVGFGAVLCWYFVVVLGLDGLRC